MALDVLQFIITEMAGHSNKIKRGLFTIITFAIIIGIFIFLQKSLDLLGDVASSKKASNTKKQKTIKHDDEYYFNLVDEYYEKVNDANIDNVILSYNNLGVIKCNGYINFRSEPNEKNTRSIIGLMNDGDALDIIEWNLNNSSMYCKVKSGGIDKDKTTAMTEI